MKLFKKVLVLTVLTIIVTSCGADRTREQKVSAMMSKIDSPFFVANMNLQNLMDKSEIMKEGTIPFTYMEVLGFFLKAEVTGIDYSTDVQIIVGEGESFTPNFYGIFKVGDQEKFTDLMETEANAEIKEKDGINYAIKESEMYCVVWDEDIAIISNIPINLMAMLSGGGDEGQKMVNKNIDVLKASEEGEIDEEWEKFLGKDADISMRYDGVGFYDYYEMMQMGEEEVEGMEDMIKGMAYDVFVNFENGSMEMEMVADLSEDLLSQLSFIPQEGVSNELLSYGKTENPLMVGSFGFETNGAMDYFKEQSEFEYDKMMGEAEELGLSVEDLKKSMNGDIVWMVEGIRTKVEMIDFGYGESFESKETEPISGFVIGLDDASYIKTKMSEMLELSMSGEASDEDLDLPEMEVWENGVVKIDRAMIYLSDNALFATNDTAWVNMIAAGEGKKVNNPDGVINAKPFGMYIDISKFASEEELNEMPDQYRKLSEDMTFSFDIKGGRIVMNMRDKSQNALKVLTEAVGSALSDFEKMSNPSMEAELEQAVQDTEDAFNDLENDLNEALDDINLDEVEDAINDAFDDLNK